MSSELAPTPATAAAGAGERVYRSELTPLSFLRRSAAVYPDRTAVVHGNRGTVYSYRQLTERVNRLASSLRRNGLEPGDRVAFLCPNIPPLVEAHFAVPAAGGVFVAINARLTAAEIAAILRHAGARFLFVDHEFAPLVAVLESTGQCVVSIDDTGALSDPYEAFLMGGSPETAPCGPEDEEQTISLCYTSGTTGPPKGVMYSHRGAYLNALGNVIETGLTTDSVFLWAHAMFHCNGWCFPWAVVAVGGTQVCQRTMEPGVVWDWLLHRGVTHYHGGPMLHSIIANHPAARRLDHPVTVTIGGAPPSPALLARLRALHFRPVHVYGLTETYAPITVSAWRQEWATLPETEQARFLARQGQGRIVADLVRVVDEAMNDVPRDGRLWARW